MNISVELKPCNSENKRLLIINGAKVCQYTEKQLKRLIMRLDNIIHHKTEVKQTYKDHFDITINSMFLGDWEISQIRQLIEEIDKNL